jgi:hypothetical protein
MHKALLLRSGAYYNSAVHCCHILLFFVTTDDTCNEQKM